jgi:hypothetical protein
MPCVPLARALLPEVVEPDVVEPDVELSDAGAAGVLAELAPVLVESPSTEIAFPPITAGATNETTPWVPDAVPSLPVVSAAFAAVAPRTDRPATKRTPQSPRDTILFMISAP